MIPARARRWSARRHWPSWLRASLLGGATAIFLLPLVWTALASVGVTPDNIASPPTWTLPPTIANYIEIGVAEPAFAQELMTSTSLSLLVTALTLTIAFAAGRLRLIRLSGTHVT
jgi:ABC-type glycerol-3-phosphate transport system permease component